MCKNSRNKQQMTTKKWNKLVWFVVFSWNIYKYLIWKKFEKIWASRIDSVNVNSVIDKDLNDNFVDNILSIKVKNTFDWVFFLNNG